ncbi:homoserine dehydrogenase [Clostridiaceae bacterium 35-E11]
MQERTMNICIIGFGNASRAFCKMLIEKKEEISQITGYDVKVVAIAGRSKGTLLHEKGIDLNKILNEVERDGKFHETNEGLASYNTVELIEKCNADIMVELSTLSITDGEPAITHIERAFQCNMHVITANKGPIAWRYKKLQKIAEEKKLKFLFETTVMDGTPIFNLVRYALPGCKVLGFKGILNSTTNFILEEMEQGKSYEDAIREAQRRGFAEADPSLDIDGWDAAAKTAALANVLMSANINPMDVNRTGISKITQKDIEEAKNAGKKIKLLCEGYIEDDRIVGKVYPAYLDSNDIFSNIDATSSIVSIITDLMGEVAIVERNPEIQQTAYGVYSDLLTLLSKIE